MLTFLKLAALLLTALILIPAGAHLFALPNKMALGRDAYFTVQGIYAGWALFAAAILAAIIANSWLAAATWKSDPVAARWAALSVALIGATLVVFFLLVFPGNQTTHNWTVQPAGWERLRRNWEYGHAISAILNFAALAATGLAVIRR